MRPLLLALVATASSTTTASSTGWKAALCDRRPMYWVHIHNAGGTSIRTLAERYGQRPLEPASVNWNFYLHEKETIHTVDCEDKAALFAEQRPATWTMIERPVDDADVACGDWFDYGVTLRRPVDTMLSSLVNNNVSAALVFELLERRRGRSVADVDLPHDGFLNDGLGHFDNYLVRFLNGRQVMRDVKLGEVTEAHLDAAIRRLEAFDVILFMEEEGGLDTVPLRRLRGWPERDADEPRRNAHSSDSKRDALAGGLAGDAADALVEKRLAILASHATLDERLFAAAKDLVARRQATFGAPVRCDDGPPPPSCAAAPPPRGRFERHSVRLASLGRGDAVFDEACAKHYVALSGLKACNLAALLPARRSALEAAHRRAAAVWAEANWSERILAATRKRGQPAAQLVQLVRGLCARSRAPHCAIASWLRDLEAAVAAVAAAGAEALVGAPYDLFAGAFSGAQIVGGAHEARYRCAFGDYDILACAAAAPATATHLADLFSNHSDAAETRHRVSPCAPSALDDARLLRVGRGSPTPPWIDADRALGSRRALPRWERREAHKTTFDKARSKLRKSFLGENTTVAHVVHTRLQINEEHLEALLEARLALFFAVTLPSMARQTTTNFAWIIYARVSKWPARHAAVFYEKLAPYAHFFIVETLPELPAAKRLELELINEDRPELSGKDWAALREKRAAEGVAPFDAADAALPRDFTACALLAHVGLRTCAAPPRFRLSTLLDGDDGLHADTILSLQRAAVHELFDRKRKSDALLCSYDTFEWSARDSTKEQPGHTLPGTLVKGKQEANQAHSKCLTPGFTVAARGKDEPTSVTHVQTRLDVFAKNPASPSHSKPQWKGPVIRLAGALPIRARTVTSHGAAELLGKPRAPLAAKAIKALGWFATSEDDARLRRAAALLWDPAYAKSVIREQIADTERCKTTYSGFSCKDSKAKFLRAYLRDTKARANATDA